MYHNSEISIINLSRLQYIVSVLVSVSANNFSTNTRIRNIGKKWYRSISSGYYQVYEVIRNSQEVRISKMFQSSNRHFAVISLPAVGNMHQENIALGYKCRCILEIEK